MKTKPLKPLQAGDDGSALLGVLFFVMLIGLAAGSLTVLLRQDLHMNRMLVNRSKAREIADGAAFQALGYLAHDMTNLHTPPSAMTAGTLGDGTYTVQLQNVAGGAAAVSQGTVDGITQQVKVYMRFPDYQAALMKGIFANGDIIGHGNGYVENGTHSNQDTGFWGNVEVRGDADSVGTTTLVGNSRVSGQARSNRPRIAFPPLNFDHYYQIALANGQVYSGDLELRGTYNPPGGVMWVDGDVRTKGNTTINGAVFATGNIEDHGRTKQNKHGDLPALASENGYIAFYGRSEFEGLIYTRTGNVSLYGTTKIAGAIIAWGDVDSYGNWGQLDFNLENPELEDDGIVEVVAWEY